MYKQYTLKNIYRNITLKNKKHLRNLEPKNDQKFKKHPGWPKNLVSYKKTRPIAIRRAHATLYTFFLYKKPDFLASLDVS